MKFKVFTKDLKAAMTTLKKGMYLNASLPIVTCIRFNTSEDSVGMVGTDLETMIAEEIPAVVESDGEACIAFKQLEACIKGKKKADHVTYFQVLDGRMILTVTGVVSQLSIQSVTEFPVIPQITTDIQMELASRIEKCLPFVSTEDDRRQITGVHVHSKEHELVFVATDGRTLKVVRGEPLHSTDGRHEFAITIPGPACRLITTKFKGHVLLGMLTVDEKEGPHQLRVHDANRELVTKLITQPYPDYESVLAPAKDFTSTVEIEVERLPFLEIINTVCSMQAKKNGYSKVHPVWMELVDGEMKIVYNDETAKASQTTSYTPFRSTGDVLMAWNPKFLIRALQSFGCDYVTMYVKPLEANDRGNKLGMVLDPMYLAGDEGEDTVIMPMKPDEDTKFGPDWVAEKREEERKARLEEDAASFKRATDEMAKQEERAKAADEWTANQKERSEDDEHPG